jgi:hypothetical protein
LPQANPVRLPFTLENIMKTLLRRAAVGLLAALACALAMPALAAVDCTAATTPNTLGTTANAQFEMLQKLCANMRDIATGEDGPTEVINPDNVQLGIYSFALGNDATPWIDTSNYNSLVAEVQQLDAGSFVVETSVDGVNRPSALPIYNMDQVASPGWGQIMVSTAKYRIPVGAKFFRVRKIGNGAAQIQLTGSQFAIPGVVVAEVNTLSWTESTATLPAGQTFSGTHRSTGGTQAGPGTRWRTFNAEVRADQAGTLEIKKSLDGGTTWISVASIAVVANTVARLSVPVFAPGYQVFYTNGSSAQGSFNLASNFQT